MDSRAAIRLEVSAGPGCRAASVAMSRHIRRLQMVTLLWMLSECAVALVAAWRARSPALLAFGSDSFVELLSATVVLLQFVAHFPLSERRASQLAGNLLFLLAGVVSLASGLALVRGVQPGTSWMGIGVTVAALIAMPILSRAKSRAARETGNLALRADAVQSATCAYLAGVTLAGLGARAWFHVAWLDPAAALLAVPIIWVEARRVRQGRGCC